MPIVPNSVGISAVSALTHGSISSGSAPSTSGSVQSSASPFDQILQAFVQSQPISLRANSSETAASAAKPAAALKLAIVAQKIETGPSGVASLISDLPDSAAVPAPQSAAQLALAPNVQVPAIPNFTSNPHSADPGDDQESKGLPLGATDTPTSDPAQASSPATVSTAQSNVADPVQIDPIQTAHVIPAPAISKALAPANGSPVNSTARIQSGRRTLTQKVAASVQRVDASFAAPSGEISVYVAVPIAAAPMAARQSAADYANQSVSINALWQQTSQGTMASTQSNTAPTDQVIPSGVTQLNPLPADSAFPAPSDLASTFSNPGTPQGKALQVSVPPVTAASPSAQNWTDSSQSISANSATSTSASPSNIFDWSVAQQNPVTQSATAQSVAAQNANLIGAPYPPDTAAVIRQIGALKATLTATPRVTSGALLDVATKPVAGDLTTDAQRSPSDTTSSNTIAPKAPAAEVAPRNPAQSQTAPIPTVSSESSGSQKDASSQSSNPGANKSHAENTTDSPAAANAEPPTFAQSIATSTLAPAQNSSSVTSTVETTAANTATGTPNPVLTHQSGADSELPGNLQAWNAGDNAQARSMQMASIARNPAPSEMNIALQAESLGNVQLRARVSGDQVGAAILVDRHDVHAALTSDLPALHQALTERQFRVENVSLSHGPIHSGNSGNAGGDAGRQTQQRNPSSQNGSSSRWTGENSAAPFDAVPGASIPDVNVIFDSNGRLSVRA